MSDDVTVLATMSMCMLACCVECGRPLPLPLSFRGVSTPLPFTVSSCHLVVSAAISSRRFRVLCCDSGFLCQLSTWCSLMHGRVLQHLRAPYHFVPSRSAGTLPFCTVKVCGRRTISYHQYLDAPRPSVPSADLQTLGPRASVSILAQSCVSPLDTID